MSNLFHPPPPFLLVISISITAHEQASIAAKILDAATLSMRNAETGLPEPQNSAVIVPDPINENKLLVGIFTKGSPPTSWTRQSSGLTDDLYICDFESPEACLNEVPYEDSDPNNPMECGISDETLPAAGYKCVVVRAQRDDNGDFSFVGSVDRPVSVCLDGEGKADTVPPGTFSKNTVRVQSRRHLLRTRQDNRAGRRTRTSNRSARRGKSRGTR